MTSLTPKEISKTKRKIHAKALGYEPLGMKPIHLVSGLLLALGQEEYRQVRLNQASVIRSGKGLQGEYENNNFYDILSESEQVSSSIKAEDLWNLRLHLNAIFNNDQAVYPAYMKGVGESGVDYTALSPQFVTTARRLDGRCGIFLIQIFSRTEDGRNIVKFLEEITQNFENILSRLVSPILEKTPSRTTDIVEIYHTNFPGTENQEWLDSIASRMEKQTKALDRLVRNISANMSPYQAIRLILLAFGCWLTSYLLSTTTLEREIPTIVFDFSKDTTSRTRVLSRFCYRQWQEKIEDLYLELNEGNYFDSLFEPNLFIKKSKRANKPDQSLPSYSFLRDHFNELTLRMGIAQPRSGTQNKHFEYQPDTLRAIILSLIEPEDILTLEELSKQLKDIWGSVFGGQADDHRFLISNGYQGVDEDDLKHNSEGFIKLATDLGLSRKPSDGLVLFGNNIESLI
jgi:hypothetical protein